jgi:hypothetical protein
MHKCRFLCSGADEGSANHWSAGVGQGCQIFLGTTYQNGEKYIKMIKSILNGHTIYQMAVK